MKYTLSKISNVLRRRRSNAAFACYLRLFPVQKEKALAACARAASAGHPVAQVNLALTLDAGLWKPRTDAAREAAEWYARAATLGEPTALDIVEGGPIARELMLEAFRRYGPYVGRTEKGSIRGSGINN
jgi:TPR repeat protein